MKKSETNICLSVIIGTLLSFFLSACGGGYNPDKALQNNAQKLGESSYFDLGNGQGLMTEAIQNIASGANFQVGFSLDDGGSFTLTTFANKDLTGGIDMVFTRSGGALSVQVITSTQTQDWSSYFTSVDAAADVQLTMDIHNNEHPAHIMVWQGAKNASMDHRNTLYNSAEDSIDLGYDNSPGNGVGRAWGFKTINSQIMKAVMSATQDDHE